MSGDEARSNMAISRGFTIMEVQRGGKNVAGVQGKGAGGVEVGKGKIYRSLSQGHHAGKGKVKGMSRYFTLEAMCLLVCLTASLLILPLVLPPLPPPPFLLLLLPIAILALLMVLAFMPSDGGGIAAAATAAAYV
ncbi:ARGOS-like protein [Andrographis paniculata]|uniref:ARGOS-like protein n=1 Tax=Andrographis paniculata TaxID=175694 RepID=UPI0021E6F76B|nr:ARGOS-like protein [Andrographis paniculata]